MKLQNLKVHPRIQILTHWPTPCLAQSPLCGMTQLLAKIDKACFPCRGHQPLRNFSCCGKNVILESFSFLAAQNSSDVLVINWRSWRTNHWLRTALKLATSMMKNNSHYYGFRVQCWSSCTNCHQSCLNLEEVQLQMELIGGGGRKSAEEVFRKALTCRAGHDGSSWGSSASRSTLTRIRKKMC